jgi:hypothetical protein
VSLRVFTAEFGPPLGGGRDGQKTEEPGNTGGRGKTREVRGAWLPFWLPEAHFGRDFEK